MHDARGSLKKTGMDHPNDLPLEPALVESVLERLGFTERPDPDLEGLRAVYAAWSRSVPFDNLRKLIHVDSGDTGPLAGDDVREFLGAWLAWGTGGTCWAGNGALCALLQALGFDAVRGIGTMMVAPDLPPNHGTVVVRMDDRRWLVDASMLHVEPLLLDDDTETGVDHPGWGVRCAKRDGKWRVRWRPLHMPDGVDCRIDLLQTDAASFCDHHEATRGWSPFNYQANARRIRDGRVTGLAFGLHVEIDASGNVTSRQVDHDGRLRVMVEDLGIHPELAERVPPEKPTPPPPWSASAAGHDD